MADFDIDDGGIVWPQGVPAGCDTCTHRIGPNTCAAFPEGIPMPYLTWTQPHLTSDGHDGEITYEPEIGRAHV